MIIDSGFSLHMIGEIKFNAFETYDGNSVKFGNYAPCPIKGKGSIVLVEKITCDNTYFVEGINYNFLSVAQLNRLGYKVEFNQKKDLFYNSKGKLNGSGDQTKGNLFFLDETIDTCVIFKYDDV